MFYYNLNHKFLKIKELRCIYDNYDKNNDGHINYAEFVNLIRVF